MQGKRITGAPAGALLAAALLAAPVQAVEPLEVNRGVAAERVPGEVIVQFERSADAGERAEARADAGVVSPENLGSRGVQLVQIADGGSIAETIRELEDVPAVKLAEPNRIEQPLAIPDDTLFGELWGLENAGQTVDGVTGVPDADIDASRAWDIGAGDPGTVVAVMDTGIDPTHPDLAPNLWQNPGETAGNGVDDDGNGFVDDANGYDFVGSGDPDPFDDGGHGTHVAGTAAGVGNNALGTTGVAQRASIMSLRVCGVLSGCAVSDQIEAINYAAANGARVLNGSLGGLATTENTIRRNAIFSHPNVLHVFAAGNEGHNVDTPPASYPCAHAPQGGEVDNTLCVAATTQSDVRPSFSNFGSVSVDLGAPGTNILSDSATRVRFEDDFDANDFATRWNPYLSDVNWASSTEPPLTSRGIAEVAAGNYAPSTTYGTVSDPVPVPAVSARGCELRYFRSVDLGTGDMFQVALFHEGTGQQYTYADGVAGEDDTSRFETLRFTPSPAAGNLRIRFRLLSDAAGVDAGVHVDNVRLTCAETPGPHDYEFLDGTSMSSPHVAGAAALLASRNPGASTSEIRAKILSTVDPNGGLAGVTTSGGRLNVGAAMAAMPADTSITGGPAEGSEIGARSTGVQRASRPGARPAFSFSSNDPNTTFQCSVDGAAFATCPGSGTQATIGPLSPGPHTFAVRSVDPRGNADTTPATRSFRVETLAPNTKITKGPRKRTEAEKATFKFRSSEPGSTFECKLDRKKFRSCKSPKRYRRLDPDQHKFKVRAIDAVGNVDRTPAKKRWTVTR